MLTPSGTNPTLNGSRILQMVSRIQVNGHRFRASWNTDLPRRASLVARFLGSGNPSELINDPFLGLVATNEWPAELQGQVRFIGSKSEAQPNSRGEVARLIRFEASPEVVAQIQAQGGSIHIGRLLGTVQSGKKAVKRGANINFVLQK